MAFRRSDLQEAFFVPGTHGFRVYGYGTADPLEAVLAPDYFATARALLRPGELIYVSAGAPGGEQTGEVRMALVMVRPAGRGAASVRLVQDFGRSDDGAGIPAAGAPTDAPDAPAPPKRGRGRPPGSRNKKAA